MMWSKNNPVYSEIIVLDSIFVRKSHRHQGLATDLIKKLMDIGPDHSCEDTCDHRECGLAPVKPGLVGLSQPVSTSMLLVTLRLLKSRPDLRDRVVLVDDCDGSRGNLWWSAMKICKDRQIKWN